VQTLLVFAVALFIAVLLSGLAHRSLLSTALLFVVVGAVARAVGALQVDVRSDLLHNLAEIALVVTLFSDGLQLGVRRLRDTWQLPGRALLIGLPLTFLAIAFFAHVLLGEPWIPALLVGAVLSPTDPVFAAALVGSERVPRRLRHLLNVESGLNDGLALPLVLVLLHAAGGSGEGSALNVVSSVLLGVTIGIVVPVIGVHLYRLPFFDAARVYRPLFAVAVLLIAWSLAHVVRANVFLASFGAGAVLAKVSPKARASIAGASRPTAELVKLGALLVFVGAVAPRRLVQLGWPGVSFAASALLIARPVAVLIALVRSELSWKERLTAAWFGPKGFASVLFGLLLLRAPLADREMLFHAVALVTLSSIVVHSTTDFFVSGWFCPGPKETRGERTVESVIRAGT
jgi:NhaP-type Na+/H+ or K+/H+ antiporter